MNLETLKLFTRWLERTEFILRLEKRKLDVDDTYELDKSMETKVHQKANDLLAGELSFLVRGRFVDMGAGRKAKKIESMDGNAQVLGVRKPKKWYSRAFWGRLNDLQGAIGYKLMESSINAVKNQLEDRQVSGSLRKPVL